MYVNELIRKQQRPAKSRYGMLREYMINFTLIVFADLKQYLPTVFAENLVASKKFK